MENLFTPNSIRTFSGLYVNVFDPKPEMFVIEDIAHHLSMIPRWTGALKTHFSVAQHSWMVAKLLPPEKQLKGLMHDSSEAYLMDIARPIKGGLANYKEIEDRVMKVIAEKFGFDWPVCHEVKKADDMMLQWEWDNLMLDPDSRESQSLAMSHRDAEILFLTQYKILTKQPAKK